MASARKYSFFDRPVWRGSSQSGPRMGFDGVEADIHRAAQTEPGPQGSRSTSNEDRCNQHRVVRVCYLFKKFSSLD